MAFKSFAVAAALAGLALTACGGAPAPAASSAPAQATSSASAAAGVSVHLSDFKISPANLSVPAGSTTFAVKNDGPTLHNLTVLDSTGAVIGTTPNLKPGESASLTVTLKSGSYVLDCSLPGHASLGMTVPLVVA